MIKIQKQYPLVKAFAFLSLPSNHCCTLTIFIYASFIFELEPDISLVIYACRGPPKISKVNKCTNLFIYNLVFSSKCGQPQLGGCRFAPGYAQTPIAENRVPSCVQLASLQQFSWLRGTIAEGKAEAPACVDGEFGTMLLGMVWFFLLVPGVVVIFTPAEELLVAKSWSPSWRKLVLLTGALWVGEGHEEVVWSAPALLESGWVVGLKRGRKIQPYSGSCPSGRQGVTPSSAEVQPSTHWLGRAGAAQDTGRGLLGPGGSRGSSQSAERQHGKSVIMRMEVS